LDFPGRAQLALGGARRRLQEKPCTSEDQKLVAGCTIGAGRNDETEIPVQLHWWVRQKQIMRTPTSVVALLMTVAPVFAQPAPPKQATAPPTQTFVLTPDGACSLKSSDLHVQFAGLGTIKEVITTYDIWWSARWAITGCKLPIFVAATFDYVNDRNEVVQSAYWWTKVKKDKLWLAREKLEPLPTGTVVKIRLVRLSKIALVTEEQYNATKQKP
jgi:hypothetical protein